MFQGDWYSLCVFFNSWALRKEPIGCPETSVRNYHNSLRNNPEERSSLYLYVYPYLYLHIIKENKYRSLHCRNRENVLWNCWLLFDCKQCYHPVCCADQRTLYLSSLIFPTALVGTARQRYTCSKNIHFFGGGRSTLSIAMKLRVNVFVT